MAEEKILTEEIFSDDELEEVSGGGTRQICGDNDLMKMIGCTHYDGTIMANVIFNEAVGRVKKGWAQVGIKMELDRGGYTIYSDSNRYFVGGTEISRKDAFTYAMKQRGWNQVAIDCFNWDNVKGSW